MTGPAGGNAVVVQRLLAERGSRSVSGRLSARWRDLRRERRVAQLATVRVETAPGDQMQIDFGQKRVPIAGTGGARSSCWSRSSVIPAASLSKRFSTSARMIGARGSPAAFMHFGGVPRTLLGDNARALVVGRDRGTGTVLFHPAYLAFCRDWDVQPRACAPYRARTKGKTEAGREIREAQWRSPAQAFDSFAALEAHLAAWMVDGRSARARHDA